MGTADDLIEWARTQLGVTEDPPGSNHVRYWDDIGQSGAQGQPWCAAFVLAGLDATGTTATTRSVYVPTITDDYDQAGDLYSVSDGQPGDQLLYDIGAGHTGILVSLDLDARTVTAIEGNTSAGPGGSQDNGGGVFQRVRLFEDVIGVGRPQFTAEEDAVADTDVVAELEVSDRAFYQLERAGGVRVVDRDGEQVEGEPFHPYRIVANTGQAYRFAQDRNDGVFSYPGLPDQARQGDRYFVAITAE
jgi:hypothetical protein